MHFLGVYEKVNKPFVNLDGRLARIKVYGLQVVYTLVFILFKFGYPLNKSRLETMYSELRTRRGTGEEALEANPS